MFFLVWGGNFRCWPKADTEPCFLPSPLTFELFIGLHFYANQIGSLQLWSYGPASEEMSNNSHYPQKNKLEFKIHCFKRNHDRITSQFCIADVPSVYPFFEIWITGSENDYPWEFNILLKTLTSWAQRDKTLQETVTFTYKKKITYNYADPVL